MPFEISRIDLGSDEAETDKELRSYFVKTPYYDRALNGSKTIVIGRKGSGKSAIYKMIGEDLAKKGVGVVGITPDYYSWSVLNAYEEAGIPLEAACSNAWKFTLLSAATRHLIDENWIEEDSPIHKLNKKLREAFVKNAEGWFHDLVSWGTQILRTIRTEWVSFNLDGVKEPTPLRAADEMAKVLMSNWPAGRTLRILLDRLDDSWDASERSKNNIIGLLRASNEINNRFGGRIVVSVFLRSDIYDNLVFHDQDKLRQNEQHIFWGSEELKEVICERVRVSLDVQGDTQEVWNELFTEQRYRSKAPAEKYIIDRTFKRPRDIISFVRSAMEVAIEKGRKQILPVDVRAAEERKYSQSKFRDLVIEHSKQFPYVEELVSSFYEKLHKQKKSDLLAQLEEFSQKHGLKITPQALANQLFVWGVIGIRRSGGASTEGRGGGGFYFYYDDPSIRPLAYEDFYIHPSLRKYLVISEKREKKPSESRV